MNQINNKVFLYTGLSLLLWASLVEKSILTHLKNDMTIVTKSVSSKQVLQDASCLK